MEPTRISAVSATIILLCGLSARADRGSLAGRLKTMSVEGFVATLHILAVDEGSQRTTWGLSLMRLGPGVECHSDVEHALVTFDTSRRHPPTGAQKPHSLALYRKESAVPFHDERLGKKARLEIIRTSPPTGRNGADIGTVRLDVRLRDGRSFVSGETALIDCL